MALLHLSNNSKIAIVGAGPAGTFFAHLALKHARARRMNVSITIFDGKDFTRAGPLGCNMCAGVLSETLLERLKKSGIILPYGRVQSCISGYHIQTKNSHLFLENPSGKSRITTIFRGNGPRFYNYNGTISFDDFLLKKVEGEGAKVIFQPVKDILLPDEKSDTVRLIYGKGGEKYELEADLVVGAFGVNNTLTENVKKLNFGYKPPKVLRGYQAEIFLGNEHIQKHIGDNIIIFRLGLKGIRFAAFTPKSEHVTVTVVCKNDAKKEDLLQILEHPTVRDWLPENWKLPKQYCSCRPKIPYTPAKNPFTDRFVIIGDASFCRYFKNGIESAYNTAKFAAETAFNLGISKSAFRKGYLRQARKLIIRDNFYGRLLFKLSYMVERIKSLSDIHIKLASQSEGNGSVQLLRNIHWGMYTGNIPYRRILFMALNPVLQLRLTRLSIQTLTTRFFGWIKIHRH